MKIVQGFLGGLLLVGVLVPVLSVTGDAMPSSAAFTSLCASGVAFPDFGCCCGVGLVAFSGIVGVAGLLPSSFSFAASRSARSCCLRSFFLSRLARSFSALSLFGVPFGFMSFGVSVPDLVKFGGGVDGFDLEGLRCGGTFFSGIGVPEPLVESVGVAAAPLPAPGREALAEFGVCETVDGVTVRRYA